MAKTNEELLEQFREQQNASYLRHSEDLTKTYQAYDKLILTLASGAVGLTLLLLKEGPLGDQTWVLQTALVLFTSSLLLTLVSYLFGILSYKVGMRGAVEALNLNDTYDAPQLIRRLQLSTDTCNLLAGVAFILGVGSTAYFVLNTYPIANKQDVRQANESIRVAKDTAASCK
jgi:hypothetical protein